MHEEDDSTIGLNQQQFLLLKKALNQERTRCESVDVPRACSISLILSAIDQDATLDLKENATTILVEMMKTVFPQPKN